jgi:hypothetical protein
VGSSSQFGAFGPGDADSALDPAIINWQARLMAKPESGAAVSGELFFSDGALDLGHHAAHGQWRTVK